MAVKRFANRVIQNELLGVKTAPLDLIKQWADEMLECIRPVTEEDKVLARINDAKCLKREFESSWSKRAAFANVRQLTLTQQRFYDPPAKDSAYAILPDDLSYWDLMAFAGKKTKITIEEIPW